MEQVKLLSMTTILTVLIWASADSLVNEAVTVSVSIELVPDAGTKMLLAPQSPNESFEVQISGPRRIVEDVQANAPLHVRLRIPDYPTGSAVIPLDRKRLKDAMAKQWNEFQKLTVVSIQPDRLEAVVDHWVTREVSILLRHPALAYDIEPQLSRTAVTVKLRDSRMRELPDGSTLQLDIGPEAERLLKEQPTGRRVTVPVALDGRVFGTDAVLSPNTIDVTATVKPQRTTAEIPTVPILFALSSANLEKPLRPVSRDGSPLSLVTRTITVTGPTEEVTKLQQGVTRVYGIIQLKEDDLSEVGVMKVMTPEFHLPTDIVLTSSPPRIEFKLIFVTSAESSP